MKRVAQSTNRYESRQPEQNRNMNGNNRAHAYYRAAVSPNDGFRHE